MVVAFYNTPSGRSPVEDFIQGLSKGEKARFADVFEGVEKYGLGCPRIAYVMVESETMVWLHAFKKRTQKTPIEDLELAEKRMKEVLE